MYNYYIMFFLELFVLFVYFVICSNMFRGQYISHYGISSKSTSPPRSLPFPSWRFYFFRHSPNDGFSQCELRDTVVHESSRNVANFLDLTLNTWILLSSSPLCFPLLSPFIPLVVRFKRFSRRHWGKILTSRKRGVISRLPFNLHRDHGLWGNGWVFFTDTYFWPSWRLLLPLFERRR